MHWLNSLLGGGVLGSIVTGALVYLQTINSNHTDLEKTIIGNTPDRMEKLYNRIDKLTKERESYAAQSIKLQQKVDSLQDTVNDQDSVIKKQTKTIKELREQVTKQSNIIDKLNAQIGKLSEKIDRLGHLEKEEINDETNK